MSGPSWIGDDNVALLTDLYELTMAAAYAADDGDTPATFELSVRSLPDTRNFLVVAGIEDALGYLERLRFDDESIAYLDSLNRFDTAFLDRLADLRFTGDVWAMPEGTVAFGTEPLMRVTGPIIEAQIVETFLLNAVGFQTMIASKAARVRLAAAGRTFVDFGARRAQGADAALKAARAAYLAGADATSLVVAGSVYGVPVTGTMAHSFVLSHATEHDAFMSFARTFPDDAVLLIDTFDTIEGARIAAEVGRRLAADGIRVRGVRLDSGDLGALAFEVRRILDGHDLEDVRIIASGGLDEQRIAGLVADGTPIDGFGVGTGMVVSQDAPSLDIVYKLVAEGGEPRMKTSTGKATLPGAHQVYRFGRAAYTGDVVALADEPGPSGEPLLVSMLEAGRRTSPPGTLEEGRLRFADQLDRLPQQLERLDGRAQPPYPVDISPALADLADALRPDG